MAVDRPFVTTLSDYDPPAESNARDEVLKAQNFVVEWFNTSPDVQDGHIKRHQWGDVRADAARSSDQR